MIPSNKINNAHTLPDNSIDLPLSPPTNMHPVTPPVHPNNSEFHNQSGEIMGRDDQVIMERPSKDSIEEEPTGDQYSFLKFHVVEDDNATEEESEESRRTKKQQPTRANGIEDNNASKNYDGFSRRKSSQNSHLSRGSGQNAKRASIKNNAMLNNYFPSSTMNNPAMSSVIKQQQQGWDKMKNLTRSVLDQRKTSKGISGTRNPIKQRKPSGEPHQMNVQNQRGTRKNSQDLANRPPSQNSKNSGKASAKPRVPLQNLSKSRENPMISLTGGGVKSSKKAALNKKQNQEPSSASGLSESDLSRDQPDNEYLETMKMRMRGLPDLSKGHSVTSSGHAPIYDQFGTADTQEIINRANQAMQFKKEQPSTNLKDKYQSSAGRKGYSLRAMKRKEEAEKKNEANNFNADLPSKSDLDEVKQKSPIEGEIDNCVQMIDEMFGARNQEEVINDQSQSHSRKPKFLMSKLTNLMRDTKSSAQRNKYRAQVTNPFGQTISIVGPPQSFMNPGDEQYATLQKSPSRKNASPKRRQHSPSNKSKSNKSSQNFQGIMAFHKVSPSKFDQIQESGNETEDVADQQENNQELQILNNQLTPFIADIPVTDSPSQVTLEGISGMVVMDSKTNVGTQNDEDDDHKNVDGMIPYDEVDIKKGESGGASSSSSSDRINNIENTQYKVESTDCDQNKFSQTLKQTLDLESITIDQQELHEISKSTREYQEKRKSKNSEFNSEILSIIGSINSRAKELKNKINRANKQNNDLGATIESETDNQSDIGLENSQSLQSLDINRDCYNYATQKGPITNRTEKSKMSKADDTQSEYDPLKAVALELSSEAIELDEQSINDNVSKKYSNLDQTIIIGEMEEGNIFDDLKMSKQSSEPLNNGNISGLQDLDKQKDKKEDDKTITIAIDDLQDLVDNIKLKHRAEIDAIMTEQGTYKRIIQELIIKLKQNQQKLSQQDLKIINLQKFELQAQKFDQLNQRLQSEVEFYRNQVDKIKVAMIEYDRHIRDQVIQANEFHIQQLETENAHLRKLLNIPDELFNKDPEEEKKREAEKKRGMLKSIDEKLKAAEKKIARKQTAQDIYYQNHKKYGFDPFELDHEEYDMYRLSKLKEHADMPKEMKTQLQNKIHNKLEDRHYQEEMRRHQEKEILQEFARVYGYDVTKHQPDPNGGEIDVEYLQAYIHECKMKEERLAEQMEAEKSLAKQKEALKGKVSQVTKTKQGAQTSNNTGTKSSTPATKKQLTVETEHNLNSGSGPQSSDSSSHDQNDNSDNQKQDQYDSTYSSETQSDMDGKSSAATQMKDPNDDEEPQPSKYIEQDSTETQNQFQMQNDEQAIQQNENYSSFTSIQQEYDKQQDTEDSNSQLERHDSKNQSDLSKDQEQLAHQSQENQSRSDDKSSEPKEEDELLMQSNRENEEQKDDQKHTDTGKQQ